MVRERRHVSETPCEGSHFFEKKKKMRNGEIYMKKCKFHIKWHIDENIKNLKKKIF